MSFSVWPTVSTGWPPDWPSRRSTRSVLRRLKRFLAPQVADLVDRTGDDSVLEGRRTEVVVVFCDLRGFTSFSAEVAPEQVMSVLSEYYEALGRAITKFAATLISFSGDGLMVLVNAPVPVEEPALRAVDLAVEMQRSVQGLIAGWRAQGYQIGFGVGLASGSATVGRIGYESRFDYTAIGSVVNLAARLCASAADQEILMDAEVAEAVKDRRPLKRLGAVRSRAMMRSCQSLESRSMRHPGSKPRCKHGQHWIRGSRVRRGIRSD